MKTVLIIGANSFIGKSFHKYATAISNKNIIIDMISASNGDWKKKSFEEYDVVLHLSGMVHIKEKKDMEVIYDTVNHRMAVDIAKKAKESSVKQFIFMSSASVFGSKVTCITKDTVPHPTTLYGKSKFAAEQDIISLKTNDFKVAIMRPPMVYGEGCKGNYPRLEKLAKVTPVFPKFHNKRSMIHINKLCDFIYTLIMQESCGFFHPQDDEYVDTCELFVKIRREMGKRTWLIGWFNFAVRFLSKHVGSMNKLFGNFFYEKNLI